MLRYGDCSSCTASACFSVPSNTGSPVVLTKSATRIESFSVRVGVECDRQYTPPAMAAASRTPVAAHAHTGTDARLAGWCCADPPACEADIGTDATDPLGRWLEG